ncbi:MAG: ribulokinase, partial [Planctomycetes bacterium]|nr:ribulokinase [Planctomycetota bacterium]
ADVLNESITVPETKQGPAVGAAILGALAAGVFPDAISAIKAMAVKGDSRVVHPDPIAAASYETVYSEYLKLTVEMSKR